MKPAADAIKDPARCAVNIRADGEDAKAWRLPPSYTLVNGQAEARAMAADMNLAAIVESSEDAIVSCTLAGRITSWNAGAVKIYGYEPAEIMGQSFAVLVPPDRLGEWREIRRTILKGGHIQHFETERLTKHGRRIFVSQTNSPISGYRDRIVGISTIARDVTWQNLAEATLRQSERNLADFFDNAPLGLLWANRDGIILRVNRLQLLFLGRSLEECVGHHLREFFEEPEASERMLDQLNRGTLLQSLRARLRRKNGRCLHVLIDANALREKGVYLHSRWFFRDISRRAQLEDEILAISEREQRRIGQDLHDGLCQELACIEFLCQALNQQLQPATPTGAARSAEIAGLVRQAIVHTRELARGLSPVGIESDGLMRALARLAAQTSSLYKIHCSFCCPGSGSVLVGDNVVGVHLFRIAQEAVSNAIRHGQAKHIQIQLVRQQEQIRLQVDDDGVGLPKNLRWYKGMGLQIMQHRANAINGAWSLDNRAGGGMTVTCTVTAPAGAVPTQEA